MGTARWDPELARDQIRIFLKKQLANGGLPDVIFENGTVVTIFGKPPVMPWACAVVDRHGPNDDFLRMAYGQFIAYEAHWRKDRGGDRDSLFHYDTLAQEPKQRDQEIKFESGWDTSPRWDKGADILWAIDLNCYMVMVYQALAYMADRLHCAADHKQWEEKGNLLAAAINKKLWNPAARLNFIRDFPVFPMMIRPSRAMTTGEAPCG